MSRYFLVTDFIAMIARSPAVVSRRRPSVPIFSMLLVCTIMLPMALSFGSAMTHHRLTAAAPIPMRRAAAQAPRMSMLDRTFVADAAKSASDSLVLVVPKGVRNTMRKAQGLS